MPATLGERPRILRAATNTTSASSALSPATGQPQLLAHHYLPCTFSVLSGRIFSDKSDHDASFPKALPAAAPPPHAGGSSATGLTPSANATTATLGPDTEAPHAPEAGASSATLTPERKKELLRAEILHNITLLLNAHSHPRLGDLQHYPELSFSVLGMGLGDFCGRSYAATSIARLQQLIREQLVHFEPRLDPASVQVVLVSNPQDKLTHTISLEIRARVQANLLDDQLFICTTEVDVESSTNVVHLKTGRV